MRRKFQLDRQNGKIMGVCAGIANHFNIDPTIVRVLVVVGTLLGAFPWTLIAYALVAWLAKPKAAGYQDEDFFRAPRTSTSELRSSMRDIDRRMAEVESYVTTTNSPLAREIEQLR